MNLGREFVVQRRPTRLDILKRREHLPRGHITTTLLSHPLAQPSRGQPVAGDINQQLGGTRAGGTNEGAGHVMFPQTFSNVSCSTPLATRQTLRIRDGSDFRRSVSDVGSSLSVIRIS